MYICVLLINNKINFMQHINILDFFILSVIFSTLVIVWVFIRTVIDHLKDKKALTKD